MLECSYFEDARRTYLPRILTTACNIITFKDIFNCAPMMCKNFLKLQSFAKLFLRHSK